MRANERTDERVAQYSTCRFHSQCSVLAAGHGSGVEVGAGVGGGVEVGAGAGVDVGVAVVGCSVVNYKTRRGKQRIFKSYDASLREKAKNERASDGRREHDTPLLTQFLNKRKTPYIFRFLNLHSFTAAVSVSAPSTDAQSIRYHLPKSVCRPSPYNHTRFSCPPTYTVSQIAFRIPFITHHSSIAPNSP